MIIVCTTAYLPAIGGAELAIYEIAKRSPALRFLIITSRFSRRVPKYEVAGNIEVRRVGFGVGADKWLLPLCGGLVALLRARREARVILWGMMVSQGTLAALVVKTLSPHIPFVLTLQEGDTPDYLQRGRGGLIWFFWKYALKRASRVTAISSYLGRLASDAGWSGKVEIIPNGVDVDFFAKRDEVAIKNIRRVYHIDESDIIILSVSRLVIKNGLDDLIRAFAIFRRIHQNAKLLLVGEGREHARLMEIAKNESVVGSVVFAGAIPPSDIVPYFHIAHIFARPSRSEGLGIAFLEAMAASVPIVATGVGGIADIIKNGETGIVVKVGDAKSIADGLMQINRDRDLQKDLTRKACAMVREQYSWDMITKKMDKVFTETLR